MTAQVIDFESQAEINADDPARIAHEYILGNPRFWLWLKLVMAVAAVLASAALDLGLMIGVQTGRQTEVIFGSFTGSTFVLWSISIVSLGVFFLLGEAWGSNWRKLAVTGYTMLVFFLAVILHPSWENVFVEAWRGSDANVFTHSLDNSAGAPVVVFSWFGAIVVALLYTVGGLLFLLSKKFLDRCLDNLKSLKEARDRCGLAAQYAAAMKEQRRLQLDIEHQAANGAALVNEALAVGLNSYRAEIAEQHKQAESTLRSVKASKAEKSKAKREITLLEACLKSLHAIKLFWILAIIFAGQPSPAQATPTVDLVAQAPVFQLLIDVSGGSPALNRDYLESVWLEIEKRLRGMPLGTTVLITSFGDAALTPLVFRSRLQARHSNEGDTLEHTARDLRGLVMSFPERMHGKEQKRSELMAGFFDASHAINPQAHGNVIVAISDLVENSPLARCDNERAKPCRLPAPSFHLPQDTTVAVYGVGQGLHSDRATLLTQQWAVFFKKAGGSAELRRN